MSTSPQTIALLAAGSLHIGGVEAHLLSLIRFSDRERYRWALIAPTSPEFAAQVEAAGATVIPWETRGRFDRQAGARLAKLLRTQQVDLLHIHDARAGIIGRRVARSLRIPVVVTVHTPSYYYDGVRTPGRRWAYQRVEALLNNRWTDRVIYVSQVLFEEALQLGIVHQQNAMAIDNGIDLTPYAAPADPAMRATCGIPADIPVCCFIGRFVEQKGVDVLVDAVAILAARSIPFHLWMIGDGPLREQVECDLAERKLVSQVTLTGYRQDIPALLPAADLLVMPSRYEGMPILLIEALAAGKPCIVTDVGENARMVRDGVEGLVIPPEDPTALAAAMSALLTDPARRQAMADAARQRSLAYDIQSTVARIQAVYASLLADGVRG